jgi:hypothetical protein
MREPIRVALLLLDSRQEPAGLPRPYLDERVRGQADIESHFRRARATKRAQSEIKRASPYFKISLETSAETMPSSVTKTMSRNIAFAAYFGRHLRFLHHENANLDSFAVLEGTFCAASFLALSAAPISLYFSKEME